MVSSVPGKALKTIVSSVPVKVMQTIVDVIWKVLKVSWVELLGGERSAQYRGTVRTEVKALVPDYIPTI